MTNQAFDPIGAWLSTDGRMRVQLRADGKFEEQRIDTGHKHCGTYRVDGAQIHFHDPKTCYEGSGELRGQAMFVEGVEFRREY